MKIRLLLFAIPFLMMTVATNAQSANGNKDGMDKKIEAKKRERSLQDNKQKDLLPVLNTTDGYMGLTQEMLKRLIKKEIPASVPKYKEGTPRGEYMASLMKWGKENLTVIKEEYRKDYK